MPLLIQNVPEHALSYDPVQHMIDLHHLHKFSLLRFLFFLPSLAVAQIRIDYHLVAVVLVDAVAQAAASHQ